MRDTNPFQPSINLHDQNTSMSLDKDMRHLRTLAVAHYVAAVIIAIFSCFGFIYVAMGMAMAMGKFRVPTASQTPDGPTPEQIAKSMEIGGMFLIAFGVVFVVAGFAIAILTFLSGRWMQVPKNRMFSIAVAILSLLNIPLGTILGIFTLIVLLRSSVAQLYRDRLTQSRQA